jgi:hypothetical protein
MDPRFFRLQQQQSIARTGTPGGQPIALEQQHPDLFPR